MPQMHKCKGGEHVNVDVWLLLSTSAPNSGLTLQAQLLLVCKTMLGD
jgi:hypothetical protein